MVDLTNFPIAGQRERIQTANEPMAANTGLLDDDQIHG